MGRVRHFQSELTVGRRFFYFTFAVQGFGRFFRIRLKSSFPFVQFLCGRLNLPIQILYGYQMEPGLRAEYDEIQPHLAARRVF